MVADGVRIAGRMVTPDGRYFLVRGRLWRMSDPRLGGEQRAALVAKLMDARRAVGAALKSGDADDEKSARARVDAVKRALGERGPVWWSDGAPDLNRHMVSNTVSAVLTPPCGVERRLRVLLHGYGRTWSYVGVRCGG